ncbi:MAG: 50S ribosomal protein L5 [Candidatus Aenigmarchaeota archaeon]|nr:50S ribosomal protein L5 [Candidatus Aenigmarchaeota archaeon]
MNPMRKIQIEKITINIGCGEAGETLEKAKALLENLTAKKVVITKTHKRTTFGTAGGRPIGCKVTLRGKDAEEFLKKALDAVDNKLSKIVFDVQGNFSFGIREHIDILGVRYDPEIGIFGMDVCVTLERPGFRVKRRKVSSKIGKKHLIKPEEAMEWIAKNYGVEII